MRCSCRYTGIAAAGPSGGGSFLWTRWRLEPPSRRPKAEPIWSEREQASRTSRALATAVQREALVLHELDGYSLQEVAALQGVTVAAVKTRASRDRSRLQRHYERLGFAARPPREARDATRLDDSPGDRVSMLGRRLLQLVGAEPQDP